MTLPATPPAVTPPAPPAPVVTPPAVTPPAPPAPTNGQPPAPEPAADPLNPPGSERWLPMRLEQHKRTVLKALGFDSEEQAKSMLADAAKAREAQETARQAAMTDLEKERERANKAERERDTEKTERASERQRMDVLSECARRGIKDVDYAEYIAGKARKEGKEISKAFDEALATNAGRVSLGLDAAPTIATPLNPTQPGVNPGAPPAPAPATGVTPPGPFNAMTATPAELAAWKTQNGID